MSESFDPELQRALEAFRARRGACPSDEVLLAYLSEHLGEEDAAAVREHVLRCGTCEALVERMRAFDAEPATVSRAAERRLDARFSAPRRRSWLAAAVWRPAVGYALALLLAYPAWRGLTYRAPAPPAPVPPAAEAAAVLDLDHTRGQPPAGRFRDGGPLVVLRFTVPRRDGFQYAARIVAGDRVVVPAAPLSAIDPNSRAALVCRRELFPPGQYTVVVTETPGGATFRYPFAF